MHIWRLGTSVGYIPHLYICASELYLLHAEPEWTGQEETLPAVNDILAAQQSDMLHMLAQHGKPLATFTVELLPAAHNIMQQLASSYPWECSADTAIKTIAGFPHALQLFSHNWKGSSVYGRKRLVLALEVISTSARVCGKDIGFSQALVIAFTATERDLMTDGALYDAAITRGAAWLVAHAGVAPAAADVWQAKVQKSKWCKSNQHATLSTQLHKLLSPAVCVL
jgi:hypothetical protein